MSKPAPIAEFRLRCEAAPELSAVWMPRKDALALLSTATNLLAACERVLEEYAFIYNDEVQLVLKAAIAKAKEPQ